MNLYMRSIGFSNMDDEDIADLKDLVQTTSDKRRSVGIQDRQVCVEYYKDVGAGIGLRLNGVLDEREKFHCNYIFPCANSDIEEHIKKYHVHLHNNIPMIIYSDTISNNEMIFALQNTIDYNANEKEFLEMGANRLKNKIVQVAALCVGATVIFPTAKATKQNTEDIYYSNIVLRSKEGHQKVATTYNEKSKSAIRTRLKGEDLLSIVDSYFLPTFLPTDESGGFPYDILGNIQTSSLVQNTETGEEIYKITINAAGVHLQVFINKYDLLGVPLDGMRFMGSCVLQGNVFFD
ncbi:MAG: DUF3881 family protein [Defluviitaleaceae bacterium]|nr:DUF3881 family protein [Defluviitaleaceae bacterium]